MVNFAEVFHVQGFDSRATPPFQMVPNGGPRYVALRDGTGLSVHSLKPTVCRVTEVSESALPDDQRASHVHGDRFFRLEGASAGVTRLVAVAAKSVPGHADIPAALLEVGVKNALQQLVAFNFVSDSAGNHTQRAEATVVELMRWPKFIWRRQANVELVNHAIRQVNISQDLGDPIELPQGSLGTTGATIAVTGLRGVDLNVFFVWTLHESGSAGDLDARATLNTAGSGIPGVCLFEDDVGKAAGLTMAHEIGHHLGLDHDGHDKIHLMWGTSGERHMYLTKEDINIVNR